MTAAADFCVAFDVQAAIRDLLLRWPGLVGVEVSTGPRRREVGEGIVVSRPRSSVRYHGAYRSEEGSVNVVADAFVPGSGEEAIDAARARSKQLANESLAALSLAEQTGGDSTLGGLVLHVGSEVSVEEADNYIEDAGQRVPGHGYTIALTLTYEARIVSPGGP